ncbi:MAG: RNase adapter RapZ [Bacteroidales bacterium]|nr:RNase adapter RapZ [Bacteroidales bacterium]
MIEKLLERYCSQHDAAIKTITPIKNSGSDREYYRATLSKNDALKDNCATSAQDETVIAVFSPKEIEMRAFLYLSEMFAKAGANVPKVLLTDENNSYLLEDLGDVSLFKMIMENATGAVELCCKSLKKLACLQFVAAKDIDYSKPFICQPFDATTIMWDLNYFKYCFLKSYKTDFDEAALQRDFDELTKKTAAIDKISFMYRDFQSRNVMVRDDEPWFIDYQSGRRGPCVYDLVSFVYQAKAEFPYEDKKKMIETYYEEMSKYLAYPREEFDKDVLIVRLVRNLQTLGAYGFRGLVEKRPHFLQSISLGINNLAEVIPLVSDELELPELSRIAKIMLDKDKQQTKENVVDNDKLVVEINSFSFLYGSVPTNMDHGGGFVFDCRALPNPYWIAELRSFTGHDKPVIDFLKGKAEIGDFMHNIESLVCQSVDKYIERNFKFLMVSFGCSGGRHRSVYCADSLAEYLQNKYDDKIKVVVRHLQTK